MIVELKFKESLNHKKKLQTHRQQRLELRVSEPLQIQIQEAMDKNTSRQNLK